MSTFEIILLSLIGLFFVGGLVLAAVVGLGHYLGWFHRNAGRANGKSHARFKLEENKILNDEYTVVEVDHDLHQGKKDKAATPADAIKDAATPAV